MDATAMHPGEFWSARVPGRLFVTPLHGGMSRMAKTRTGRNPQGKKKGESKSEHLQRAYFMRVQFVRLHFKDFISEMKTRFLSQADKLLISAQAQKCEYVLDIFP